MATGGGDSGIVDEVEKITFRSETEQLEDFKSAGYAALILNYKFKHFRELSIIGAKQDAEYFKNVFEKKLGLEWINENKHENLQTLHWDHSAMGSNSSKVVKYEFQDRDCCLRCNILSRDYSNCKFFVLVASSHGIEHQEPKILMCDDEKSSDGKFKVVLLSEITDALSVEKLASVTKILILNTCRTLGHNDSASPDSAEGAVGGTASTTDKRDDIGVSLQVDVRKPMPEKQATGGYTDIEAFTTNQYVEASTSSATSSPVSTTSGSSSQQTGTAGNQQSKEDQQPSNQPSSNSNSESLQAAGNRQGATGGAEATRSENEDISEELESDGRDRPVIFLGEPPANFLIVYATTKGRQTYWNDIKGSWVSTSMNKVAEQLTETNTKLNFLNFLTETNNQVCTLQTFNSKIVDGKKVVDENGKKVADENKQFKSTMCITHRLCEIPMFDLGVAKSQEENRQRQQAQNLPPSENLFSD